MTAQRGSAPPATEESVASDAPLANQIRIAAVGDFHCDEQHANELREHFAGLEDHADVLVLCGDLTTHGTPEQVGVFVQALRDVRLPIVAVLGNHDVESDASEKIVDCLRDRGVAVLDGDSVIIHGVGFAGTKGFGGGFGRGMLGPFGEPEFKQVVRAAVDESLKLEHALRTLNTAVKVVVLHYAPIIETLLGEPEMIYPFLGSSRLLPPIESYGANAVFHGHAHTGQEIGHTPSGVPVYNVALPLLKARGARFRLWTAPSGSKSA